MGSWLLASYICLKRGLSREKARISAPNTAPLKTRAVTNAEVDSVAVLFVLLSDLEDMT